MSNGNMSIPILGIPLLVDSFQENGMLDAIDQLTQGADFRIALGYLKRSNAAKNPIGFTISEALKWKGYKAAKEGTGKLFDAFGFNITI